MTYLRVATSGRLSLQNFNFPMQRGRSFILDGLWSERLFKRSQRRPIETTWGQTPRRKNILKKTETPFTIAVKIILLKKKKMSEGTNISASAAFIVIRPSFRCLMSGKENKTSYELSMFG